MFPAFLFLVCKDKTKCKGRLYYTDCRPVPHLADKSWKQKSFAGKPSIGIRITLCAEVAGLAY